MAGTTYWIVGAAALALAVAVAIIVTRKMGPAVPKGLRPGRSLPDFSATDEQGNVVNSRDLVGTPTAILFVRGNWCPFCTRQVESLAGQYNQIGELGARLIFLTPKPLETTRRVADFFDVKFDFWMDDGLRIARQLGLLLPAGVPRDQSNEYGEDTVWPTALVIDREGIIRFAKVARFIADRPDPKRLVRELQRL